MSFKLRKKILIPLITKRGVFVSVSVFCIGKIEYLLRLSRFSKIWEILVEK